MTKKDIEQVLSEIFDPIILCNENPLSSLNKSPSYEEIVGLIKLIILDKSEESFQKYLSTHQHFLFRLAPSSEQSVLGLLLKLPISNFNFTDFAILTVSQGGCRISLIEIERPSDKLFTKKLTPAAKLQTALGQIHDWNEWLNINRQTFLNTTFKLLDESPKYSAEGNILGGFINGSIKEIRNVWSGFGGNDYCKFEYLIIIGRWSRLTDREKKRLVYLNQQNEGQAIRIRTYDNFIRKAIEGPNITW